LLKRWRIRPSNNRKLTSGARTGRDFCRRGQTFRCRSGDLDHPARLRHQLRQPFYFSAGQQCQKQERRHRFIQSFMESEDLRQLAGLVAASNGKSGGAMASSSSMPSAHEQISRVPAVFRVFFKLLQMY